VKTFVLVETHATAPAPRIEPSKPERERKSRFEVSQQIDVDGAGAQRFRLRIKIDDVRGTTFHRLKTESAADLVARLATIASRQRVISVSSLAMRASSSCSDMADKSSPRTISGGFFLGSSSSGSMGMIAISRYGNRSFQRKLVLVQDWNRP
jgi:hypothetical protein